jgi:hypothetical protein
MSLEELTRLAAAIFTEDLRPADLEWLLAHFLSTIPSAAESTPESAADTERALIACHLFLSALFSNVEHEAFDQIFPEGMMERLLGIVLGQFDRLPAEAQRYLAEAMFADAMLRGALPAEFIERLLAMDPRPAGIELLIEGYAKDPAGSEFIATLGADHFDFGGLGKDPKVLVPAIAEHLRAMEPAERLSTANAMLARGGAHEEKISVFSALARVGDKDAFFALASALESDPAMRRGAILEGHYIYGATLSLVVDGHVGSEDLLDRIAVDPATLQQAWIHAMEETRDESAFRFLLGLESRSDRRAPLLAPAERALAIECLVDISSASAVDSATWLPLRDILLEENGRTAFSNTARTAVKLAGKAEDAAIGSDVRRVLEQVSRDERRPAEIRERAAKALQEL